MTWRLNRRIRLAYACDQLLSRPLSTSNPVDRVFFIRATKGLCLVSLRGVRLMVSAHWILIRAKVSACLARFSHTFLLELSVQKSMGEPG
jgi:hypothetical protein